jgi:predicted NUDIX family NTP pyrophosphohydrolase
MRQSAGILLYRFRPGLELFLVHPGGPYWKGKEAGAWTIPKGEFTDEEEPLSAAKREFLEETGNPPPGGAYLQLTPVKQKAGKMIHAWAAEGDVDADKIRSNTFRQEWPYRSGKWKEFPEVDKAAWFSPEVAKEMINPAQASLITELEERLETGG